MSLVDAISGDAPADVKLEVLACGGTRRVRAVDVTVVRDVGLDGHEAYVTQIPPAGRWSQSR